MIIIILRRARNMINLCMNGNTFWHSTDDLDVLWKECNRSDWFLWILEKGDYHDDHKLRKFACECIRKTPYKNNTVAWDYIHDIRTKAAVIETENYLEGKTTKEELKDTMLWAYTVTTKTKESLESFVPLVADLEFDALFVAYSVSWHVALASGDLKKALEFQADLIREIISYDDMKKAALVVRSKEKGE